jgi:predicted RNA binding protein YcfA (HicA-like mRNA interferase family)
MNQFHRAAYTNLISLLEHLGFEDESVAGSHHAFRHRASETLILLSDFKTEDPVRSEDLISVRWHLDAKGLMDARTFERQFPQSTARETP